jgi:hypothetical protein
VAAGKVRRVRSSPHRRRHTHKLIVAAVLFAAVAAIDAEGSLATGPSQAAYARSS